MDRPSTAYGGDVDHRSRCRRSSRIRTSAGTRLSRAERTVSAASARPVKARFAVAAPSCAAPYAHATSGRRVTRLTGPRPRRQRGSFRRDWDRTIPAHRVSRRAGLVLAAQRVFAALDDEDLQRPRRSRALRPGAPLRPVAEPLHVDRHPNEERCIVDRVLHRDRQTEGVVLQRLEAVEDLSRSLPWIAHRGRRKFA